MGLRLSVFCAVSAIAVSWHDRPAISHQTYIGEQARAGAGVSCATSPSGCRSAPWCHGADGVAGRAEVAASHVAVPWLTCAAAAMIDAAARCQQACIRRATTDSCPSRFLRTSRRAQRRYYCSSSGHARRSGQEDRISTRHPRRYPAVPVRSAR